MRRFGEINVLLSLFSCDICLGMHVLSYIFHIEILFLYVAWYFSNSM